VVGAYLEFRGEGAAALTLGDRATISNMAPEYGATAAMFFIDRNTLDYLRLTGRSDAQVTLVETYAKHAGLWADDSLAREYERSLHFDLSTVVRNMAGPSNPHKRLPTIKPGRTRHRRSRGRCRAKARCRTAPSSSPRSPRAPTPRTRAT
jgi:aconitase A